MGVSASQMNTLRSKVKAEYARRNGYQNWADSDPSVTPVAGETIRAAQGTTVVDQMLIIRDIGNLSSPVAGNPIPAGFDYTSLNNLITAWSAENVKGASSCMAACTGLCVGMCFDTCTGCTGGCTGCQGCTGGCDKNCGSNCYSTCSGCSSGCGGCSGCSAGCGNGSSM